jgi:hypothetical protein
MDLKGSNELKSKFRRMMALVSSRYLPTIFLLPPRSDIFNKAHGEVLTMVEITPEPRC